MDPVTRLIRKAFHLFEHSLSSLLAIQSTDIANITLLLTCQSIKISTLKTLIHRFTLFLGYFCVLSLRTRIDAVKADARRNPKTMMRPGRAKPCSHCMTHFHFQTDKYEKVTLYWAELCIKTAKKYLGIPARVWEPASLRHPTVSNQPFRTTIDSAQTIIDYRCRILTMIRFIIEWSLSTSLTCKLRQRSVLSLNRSVKWKQTHPTSRTLTLGAWVKLLRPSCLQLPQGMSSQRERGCHRNAPAEGLLCFCCQSTQSIGSRRVAR